MVRSIQPLNRNHDVRNFDCNSPPLNTWLQKTARQHQEKNISRTYVIVDDESPSKIMGFYAITLCEVHGPELPPAMAKKLPRTIPAMRLGRLATDKQFQGNKEFRIGETLLIDAMMRVKALSNEVGGFALFVDAKDEEAAGFYLKYGFIPLPDDPLRLMMPMGSIPG